MATTLVGRSATGGVVTMLLFAPPMALGRIFFIITWLYYIMGRRMATSRSQWGLTYRDYLTSGRSNPSKAEAISQTHGRRTKVPGPCMPLL